MKTVTGKKIESKKKFISFYQFSEWFEKEMTLNLDMSFNLTYGGSQDPGVLVTFCSRPTANVLQCRYECGYCQDQPRGW